MASQAHDCVIHLQNHKQLLKFMLKARFMKFRRLGVGSAICSQANERNCKGPSLCSQPQIRGTTDLKW